jgi:hypothetical protein
VDWDVEAQVGYYKQNDSFWTFFFFFLVRAQI